MEDPSFLRTIFLSCLKVVDNPQADVQGFGLGGLTPIAFIMRLHVSQGISRVEELAEFSARLAATAAIEAHSISTTWQPSPRRYSTMSWVSRKKPSVVQVVQGSNGSPCSFKLGQFFQQLLGQGLHSG